MRPGAAPDSEPLLLAAVRTAPRPYRLPPLPADPQAARQGGFEVALAFAIEEARRARLQHRAPAAGTAPLFTWALAELVRSALASDAGDPAFQAMVLRQQAPAVEQHVRLLQQQAADRRAVRAAVDAIAHPGKLRGLHGALRDALSPLHHLVANSAWAELAQAAAQALAPARRQDLATAAALEAIVAQPALQRLQEEGLLRARPEVQRYLALCAQRGPLAGSQAAAAQGRASARIGEAGELAALEALRTIAMRLNERAGGSRFRAVGGLRTPASLKPLDKAKDEWDSALLHDADIVLLAEVKTSPSAAIPDFPRLLRGLRRLAQAEPDAWYDFPTTEGRVRLHGASLARLQPPAHALPPCVVYACCAPVEPAPPWLAASTRAVLLAEAESLQFARRLQDGESPCHEALAPIWLALPTAPRLRAALHQWETARTVREAMLRPDELVQAVRELA